MTTAADSDYWDIDPLDEIGRLRIENACCHAEIERLRAALEQAVAAIRALIEEKPHDR